MITGVLIIWLLITIVLLIAYAAYRINMNVETCPENRTFDKRMFQGACIALPVAGLVLTLIFLLI